MSGQRQPTELELHRVTPLAKEKRGETREEGMVCATEKPLRRSEVEESQPEADKPSAQVFP